MATTDLTLEQRHSAGTAILTAAIVGLTLATAAIHAGLGGPLFTINALGYGALAMLLVVPGSIGRVRWLVRLALLGFTLATIGGWVLFGARFGLAYVDKAIEVVLVALLALELWWIDGGPAGIIDRGRVLAISIVARLPIR